MAYVTFVPQAPVGESADPGIFVQGTHVPAPLVEASGVWLSTAGSAMLLNENYRLSSCEAPLWLVVDDGTIAFEYKETELPLKKGECVVIPAQTEGCMLKKAKDARLLWLTVEGPLTEDFMRQMNAFNRVPAKQGMLPSMVILIRQIVQVLVRHTGTGEASYQLGQLLWGLIAAHSGQSVATSATLSHEIARVVDALRACRYRDAFSLADMAAISRMPVETFRKRFTAELGIPPLGYLQFLKMERAKTLLRDGMSVRQTGVEIGMPDPYHFSKQFKHIVGMSPTAYLKHVGTGDRPLHGGNGKM
ncbi:MAG: AraC family transcriptional regulator [Clostridiales bacterium]|nr:AraC family transcriptional regulator [Clostridiales bacterium]MDO4349866.1 AraC family transcriptional regulator [Eubacteriales bacterium]MDY4007636.1 AraC family transcriptional regulator [Candidatus Limiplasma sp.]